MPSIFATLLGPHAARRDPTTQFQSKSQNKMGKVGNPNWQPGVSGNPGGRSKELAAHQSAARLKAASYGDESIEFLVNTLLDDQQSTAYRLKAATELPTTQHSILPEVPETGGRKLSVANRVLDVLMTEVML